jgi:hypothetical protein
LISIKNIHVLVFIDFVDLKVQGVRGVILTLTGNSNVYQYNFFVIPPIIPPQGRRVIVGEIELYG